MKTLKFIAPLILLACIVCAPGLGRATDMQITDMAGRKVSVPVNPQRILCLGPGCLRLIVYLGALDKVVGVERFERRMAGRAYYLAHQKTIDALPVVSPGGPAAINKKPDLEKVLGVRPQVVFFTMLKPNLAAELQEKLGIPVVLLDYGRVGSFSDLIYKSLRVAGKVLSREKRAQEVIAYIEKGRADVSQRCKGLAGKGPKVYVGGVGFKGFHGIDSTNTQYVPFMWTGAITAVKSNSKRSYLFLDREQLLKLQPQVIFLDGAGLEMVKTDYAKKPDFYKALKAFQQSKTYILYPYNWYSTNLGTALADAYCIGKILRPQGFEDVDLVKKTDAIYEFLLGKPIYSDMSRLYGPLGAKPPFIK